MERKAGIIGFGKIGGKVWEKLLHGGWRIAFAVDDNSIYVGPNFNEPIDKANNWPAYCEGVFVIFLAIPTSDDGKIARDYIQGIRRKGILVVTCEKGALANYFKDLLPEIENIGYGATVGGGSGLIYFLRQRFSWNIREVHAVLNGTINYIFDGLRQGIPLSQIVEQTRLLGYAEPGENDPFKIISTEATKDVPKKAAILYNLCFFPDYPLSAEEIEVLLTKEDIQRAIRESEDRKFVVSFQNMGIYKEEVDSIPVFRHFHDTWAITAEFRSTKNPLIARLSREVSWVNNGILVVEGQNGEDGVYTCVGPGAGPSPTAAAMIRDAERLCC